MPIPYMGSKRKSSQEITNIIEAYCPDNNKIIVDLFTGGFAIGEKFLKKGYTVYANDKNKHVIALLEQTINIGLDEKKCTEWVSRDKFLDVIGNPDKYDDWYVGYIQCVWSFGNNQKGYLFGKDTEPYKQAGHEIVIDKNPDNFMKLFPTIPKQYIDGIMQQDNWYKRRIALGIVSRKMKCRILELEQLERLERVTLTSLSYEEVPIPKNAIIYCDPPYKGTATYKEGGFDHDKFWQWVREQSKTHQIFVSEYRALMISISSMSFHRRVHSI